MKWMGFDEDFSKVRDAGRESLTVQSASRGGNARWRAVAIKIVNAGGYANAFPKCELWD
jgi:hypothetical protein